MAKIWILAADRARARVFEATATTKPLTEIASFVHPQAQQRARKLFENLGSSETDIKYKEARRFARQLGGYLDQGRMQTLYDQLALIAPQEFLRVLRDSLNAKTLATVSLTVDKHYVDLDPAMLHSKLLHEL